MKQNTINQPSFTITWYLDSLVMKLVLRQWLVLLSLCKTDNLEQMWDSLHGKKYNLSTINCHKFSCMQNISWSTVIFTLKIKSEVQVNQQTQCYTIQWEQLPVIWNQTLLINSISKRLNNFTHITLNSCVICKTTADVHKFNLDIPGWPN